MAEVKDQASSARKWRLAFWMCLAALVLVIAVVIVAGIVVAAVMGSDFVAFGISSDISEYIQLVEQSDLDADAKAPLLGRLQALRERARDEKLVGFWKWMDYDESIRALIEDGVITESELPMLESELASLEAAQ